MNWPQIFKEVDEILGRSRPRVHRFPWAEGKEIRKPEIEILPHGAKLIKEYWIE
jgi:hypothetical protein